METVREQKPLWMDLGREGHCLTGSGKPYMKHIYLSVLCYTPQATSVK